MKKSDEINSSVATVVAAVLLWYKLEDSGIVSGSSKYEDRERARDLEARCQEHGARPDPREVLREMAGIAERELGVESDSERFVLEALRELRLADV